MDDVNAVPANAPPTDAIKALMMVRVDLVQREARMSEAIHEQVQSLRQETAMFRRELAAMVEKAGAHIAQDARDAMSHVAAEYGQAVSIAAGQLRSVGRIAWLCLGAVGVTLLSALFVAWAVLGYYRRELAATKEELQRYEDAVPVVQAFYASDAVICGDVICTQVDPRGSRVGDKGQYRAAKARAVR